MAKVKICGIRLQNEIEILNRMRPDYAGFVFAPSKRRVDPATARHLIENLDSGILPVGVFADFPARAILDIAKDCSLKVIQLHGSEDACLIEELRQSLPPGIEIWKALKAGPGLKIRQEKYQRLCSRILFDSASPGSGNTFDYSLLPGNLSNDILAGGLTPVNVRDAISMAKPYAVDVSSGVEGPGGYKDGTLIKKFIIEAKEAMQ